MIPVTVIAGSFLETQFKDKALELSGMGRATTREFEDVIQQIPTKVELVALNEKDFKHRSTEDIISILSKLSPTVTHVALEVHTVFDEKLEVILNNALPGTVTHVILLHHHASVSDTSLNYLSEQIESVCHKKVSILMLPPAAEPLVVPESNQSSELDSRLMMKMLAGAVTVVGCGVSLMMLANHYKKLGAAMGSGSLLAGYGLFCMSNQEDAVEYDFSPRQFGIKTECIPY